MNEADELVERLQVIVGGPRPGQGAVVDAVTKCGGDDLSSLEIEVEFRDPRTDAKHSTRFGEVERLAGVALGEVDLSTLAEELIGMILTELDEILFAID